MIEDLEVRRKEDVEDQTGSEAQKCGCLGAFDEDGASVQCTKKNFAYGPKAMRVRIEDGAAFSASKQPCLASSSALRASE